MESLNGIKCAFDKKIHEVRGHKGQIETAKNILKILKGSSSIKKQGDLRVQDPYTLRCTPQIHPRKGVWGRAMPGHQADHVYHRVRLSEGCTV
jgi:histidine ammonia-lyase